MTAAFRVVVAFYNPSPLASDDAVLTFFFLDALCIETSAKAFFLSAIVLGRSLITTVLISTLLLADEV
jgi:hypothetical protein